MIEIVAPAGNLNSLKTALKFGANSIYCGLKGAGNARNFSGLNFDIAELKEGIELAHKQGAKVYATFNTYPSSETLPILKTQIQSTVKTGIDALILADIALLKYAAENFPNIKRHLSVQAGATNIQALSFYQNEFGVKRAILPRVFNFSEIKDIKQKTGLEIEVFGFGGLCNMVEGKCMLSYYLNGFSPNVNGVCSPECKVEYQENSQKELECRLGGHLINIFKEGEPRCYPTACKGKYLSNGKEFRFGMPASLNILDKMNELENYGIDALKIEGRQRGKSYIKAVLQAIKSKDFAPLKEYSEGLNFTKGAYENEN